MTLAVDFSQDIDSHLVDDLARATSSDHQAAMLQAIRARRAVVARIILPGGSVCHAVLREQGKALICEALAGTTVSRQADKLLALLQETARWRGQSYISFETRRPGLARVAGRMGHVVRKMPGQCWRCEVSVG